MKPAQTALVNDTPYDRIDAMRMSVTDRESAKAHLRAAEEFADAICAAGATVSSWTAFVARQVRSALAPTPQH